MKEEFEQFLIEHNAYDAFCENLKNNNIQDNLEEHIRQVLGNIISNAFLWSCTPQGFEYWRDLHHKWKNYITNKN